jgi:hypothetical protein
VIRHLVEASCPRQDPKAVIVTLCVRGKPPKSPSKNEGRLRLLRRALHELANCSDWLPIDAVLLPAGYFRITRYTGKLTPTKRRCHLAREPVIKATILSLAILEKKSSGTHPGGSLIRLRHYVARNEQTAVDDGSGFTVCSTV